MSSEEILEVGSRLNHFEVVKQLGVGGMGAVYLCSDVNLSRRVAVKVMNRSLIAQEVSEDQRAGIEQRFIREARSAAMINHPNLAQIYDANFENDPWYIAMEFIEGKDLISVIEAGKFFSMKDTIKIGIQAVEGLKHAWDEHKVIHRDIKPHNLMVTTKNVVKIVDLGLAKPATSDDEKEMQDLTMAGQAIGTPQYMAPEQAIGEKNIDFRTDIFALGVTFYEMLTGEKPFVGNSPTMIYMAQQQRHFKPLDSVLPDCPKSFNKLIDQMLEPDRGKRISSYQKLLIQLKSIDNELSGTTQMPETDGMPSLLGTVVTPVSKPSMTRVMTNTIINELEIHPVDHLICGRYRVLSHIGSSKSGTVYRCFDIELELECAVKSLVAGREIAPQHMDHMRKQYQKLMQIRAKGLMSMRDIQFDEENQELFIVMELLPGKNLRQTTKHMAGKSPEERLKLLSDELHQISSILDMLFNNTGFVHGDLKPESIFYTDQDRELYLLDYGVTNFLSHQQRKLTPEDTLVVPNYAAPEYWEQKALDNRSQQYSLACVIYELLTDQLVFDYNSDLLLKETEMSIEDDERLKRYSQMVKTSAPQIVQIPEHIQVILLKALSKSPSDRYENCSSFIKNLIPKQEFRDSKKSPALAMVMGIAIIALAIGGIMMMNKESGKESQQAQLAVSTQTTEPKGTAPSATAPTLEGPPPPEEVVQSMKSPTTEVKEGKSWEEQNAAAQLQEKLENQATIKITQVEARWAELEPNAQKYSIDTRFFTETLNKMKDFLKDKQYSPVVRTGKQALLQLEQIQTQINDQIFELVEKNKKQIQGFIRTLGTWTQFAPSLNEPHARAKKDLKKVNLLIVQDSPTKALQLSEKVLSNLNKTQTKIEKEIIPKKGKDFKMPNSLIDFVWIKELNAWVAKYETTNQQYRRFQPAHTSRAHENFTLDNEMQPVCWLSLHDVKTYIEWLNELCDLVPYLPEGYEFRLPNTREWKTFASCGQEYTYIWGNAWPPSYGNFANPAMFPENWQLDGYEAEFSVTCPVEQSGKNDWGIFGCAGNLWEWTSETKGRNQAVFGGAWTSTIKQLLKYDLKGKNFASPDDKYDNIGFRVVLAQPINK